MCIIFQKHECVKYFYFLFFFPIIVNSQQYSHIKIPYCCPENYTLMNINITEGWKCVEFINQEIPQKWEIPVFKSPYDKIPSGYIFPQNSDQLRENIPKCQILHEFNNIAEIWYRVLESGKLVVGLHFWVQGIWLSPTTGEFCLGLDESNEEHLLFCKSDKRTEYMVHRWLYSIVNIISTQFLILTLATIFWKKIRVTGYKNQTLMTWIQCSITTALLFQFFMDSIRSFMKLDGLDIRAGVDCFVLATIAQYANFSFPVTGNVLGFAVLWTFVKRENPVTKFTKIGPSWRDVLIFVGVPWACVFGSVSFALIYHHASHPDARKNEHGIFEYGFQRCSSSLWESSVYGYGILYIFLVLYFAATTIIIIKEVIIKKMSKAKSFPITFWMLVKLTVVMGVLYGHAGVEVVFGHLEANPMAWYWASARVLLFGLQGVWTYLLLGWPLMGATFCQPESSFSKVTFSYIKICKSFSEYKVQQEYN